jgi:hypothetical protein
MPLYGTISATFILDRDMKIKRIFEDWMNEIVSRTDRTVGYYEKFTKVLDIFVTDKEYNIVHAVRCYDVFPKTVSDIRLDYSSKEILRLGVEFSMKRWEILNVDANGNVVQTIPSTKIKIEDRIQELRRTDTFLSQTLDDRDEGFGTNNGGYTQPAASGLTGNFVKDAKNIGGKFSSEAQRATKGTFALVQSSPTASPAFKNFSSTLESLGQATGKFGTALAGIGDGIRNVVAPAAALKDATIGVANVLGTVNSAAASLGLGSPFGSTQADLLSAAGKLTGVANAAGIPGSLGSIGASMGAVGGGFQAITRSIGGVPGATDKIKDSISSIGSIFSKNGNDIQASSGDLQDGVSTGKYT